MVKFGAEAGMKVAKFGGSSLASAEQVKKVCEIVLADAERKIVVVSAPGKREKSDTKVTDMLIAAARARFAGRSGEEEIALVIERYASIAADLGMPADSVEPIARDLHARMAMDPHDKGLFLDTMKAAGEDNCAKLVAAYLQSSGVEASYIDPREAGMVLSDEAGNARVLPESYEKLRALRDRPGILIFPGFFGYSHNGKVVTFPRGGSDITGSILAAAVHAELYENFTDVDSVFAANPSIVDHPVAVAEISYREMRELSYAGFSVFHDEALEPVFHAHVPVAIKNTNNPAAPGTRLVPERDITDDPVVGIAATSGFVNIFVSKYMMNREVGFGRRLLQIFEDEGIPFEHMPSGIDNLSVIVRDAVFPKDVEEHVLEHIRQDLLADDVDVIRNLALVMVVGEGMRHTVGLAARACNALARADVNIEMINQGASEVSMMFGIEAPDVRDAVRSLYEEFFAPVAV